MDPKNKVLQNMATLDHLNMVFGQMQSMREHLCIDESTIHFKGRLSLNQSYYKADKKRIQAVVPG